MPIRKGSVSTLLGYVQRIGDIPNFEYVLAFVGGLTLGPWIDAILWELKGVSLRNTPHWATKPFA